MAVPTFQFTPTAISGAAPSSPVTADLISGNSSELLNVSGCNISGQNCNISGSGFLQVTGFSLASNALFGNVTGLGNQYGLYFTFSLNTTGGITPGSNNAVNTLNFTLWSDPGLNTTFTQASVSGNTFVNASVNGNTTDDRVIAFGSLAPGPAAAGFDTGGGAFFNSVEFFNLCSGVGTAKLGANTFAAAQCLSNVGTQFFTAPVPFYSLAFDQFNNTLQGVTQTTDGSHIAIRSATGSIDFAAVPEPSSLALFGIAAVGLGLSLRRRRKS